MLNIIRRETDGAYEPAHIYDGEDGDRQFHPADVHLEKSIHERLAYLYPGHPWMVTARTNPKKGYIKLCLPCLMDCDYDMTINDFWAEPHKLYTVAGEILERFGVPRARYDQSHMVEAGRRFGQAERWRTRLPGGF